MVDLGSTTGRATAYDLDAHVSLSHEAKKEGDEEPVRAWKEAAQLSTDNIDRLMENVENHKEKMLKLKYSLVNTREEGIELKIKHDAILSENERLERVYQTLEIENDALYVHVVIMEGEKKDFETKISKLESREYETRK